MKARAKKTISLLLMVIEIIGFSISAILCYLAKNYDIGIASKTMFVAAVIFGLSLLDMPILFKILNAARDELDYDEFGVKKTLNKHTMSRAERERMDAEKMAEMERIISPETIKRITKKGSSDPEKDIAKLIGLSSVKKRISDMEARMQFEESDKGSKNRRKEQGNHMVFFGPPGTGKTTVARIITGLLWDYEYIDQNKIIEVDGNFFKCQNSSDAAIKTKAVIRAAYGGVLFIDEAYALCQGVDGDAAIATLIKEMEDNRSKFVLILAGYENEMNMLLQSNPGFLSRIKDQLKFENYDKMDLRKIFVSMARDAGYSVSDDMWEDFDAIMLYLSTQNSWGNARTVRNVLEQVIDNHAVRFIRENLPKEQKHLLTMLDLRDT